MLNTTAFINSIGLPEELVPVLAHESWPNLCEYASIKSDGTPVTVAIPAFPGEHPGTIAIGTGLAWPAKAERARKNPQVCLLYSDPKGLPVDDPPVILIYGHATVRDADLQANLDRHIGELKPRTLMIRMMPGFVLRWMSGYLARIWIEVTPLKVLWWPDADLEKPPLQWQAPPGTSAPQSDPPPKPPPKSLSPLYAPPQDWRKDMAYAFDRLGTPILTVVDQEGYPVPIRAHSGTLQADGVRLDLPSAMPTEAKGRACLTFHTVHIIRGEQIANENRFFIGDVAKDKDGVLFRVERQISNMSAKLNSPSRVLSFISTVRNSGELAEIQAARRGQRAPKVGAPVS